MKLAVTFFAAWLALLSAGCASTSFDRIPDDVLTASEVDLVPALVHREAPLLTRSTLARPITIHVLFVVEPSGDVRHARVDADDLSPAEEEFGVASVECVRRWRFTPGRKDGEAVRVVMRVPIVFSP